MHYPNIDFPSGAREQILGENNSIVFVEGFPDLTGGDTFSLCYTGEGQKGEAYFQITQAQPLSNGFTSVALEPGIVLSDKPWTIAPSHLREETTK